MKNRAHVSVGAALLAAAAIAYLLYAGASSGDASSDSRITSSTELREGVPQEEVAEADEKNPSVPDHVAAALRAKPLPPANLPLVDVFRELDSRARNGDARAACRLTSEIVQCRTRKKSIEVAEQITSALSDPDVTSSGDGVGMVASMLNHNDALAPKCEGFESLDADPYAYQTRAADIDSQFQRWLAANPALDQDNVVGELDRWTDYERRARRYFTRSMVARSVEDLPLLLLVHGPDSYVGMRPPYRDYDPSTFLALMAVADGQGIRVPGELIEAANRLSQQGAEPDRDVIGGWRGEVEPHLEKAVSSAMHPSVVDKDFCGGSG